MKWNDAGRLRDLLYKMNNFLSSHLGPTIGPYSSSSYFDGTSPPPNHNHNHNNDVKTTQKGDDNDDNDDPHCSSSESPFGVGGLNGILTKLTKGEVNVSLDAKQTNTTFFIDGMGSLTFGLNYFNLSGINTLTNLTVVEPLDEHLLSTGVGMESFNVTLGVVMEISPVDGVIVGGEKLVENFHLDLVLSDVNLFLTLLLAVERDIIGDLTVYQLLYAGDHDGSSLNNSKVDWPCIFSTLYTANFTDLAASMKVNAIHLFPQSQIHNPLEMELDKLINDVINLFVHDYNKVSESETF